MKKIVSLFLFTLISCAVFAIDPIAGPSTVCAGSTITLTDATPGGTWSTSSSATGTISTGGVLTGIASGVVTVTYTVGGPYVTMDVTVNPTGMLVSTLSPPAICDSTVFNYTPTVSSPGATLAWSRAVVPNISALAATGSGAVSELLHNLASFPVTVAYVFTVTTGPCTSTSTVTVNVNPTPRLVNTLPPAPICDSTLFTFAPASATVGTTYSWVRPFVTGIPMLSGLGTGNVSETLDNATNATLTVTYIYTLSANGCTNTQNVPVKVHPTPLLSSLLQDSVCSNETFHYTPTSFAVPPVTYMWVRAAVAGIANTPGTGVGSISEVLSNTTSGSLDVSYTYTLTVTGSACSHIQPVTVSVLVGGDCITAIPENVHERPAISMFPNPAKGAFSVLYDLSAPGAAVLGVTDITGRSVLNSVIKPGETARVAPGPGIYIVSVTGVDGVYTGRVVVE